MTSLPVPPAQTPGQHNRHLSVRVHQPQLADNDAPQPVPPSAIRRQGAWTLWWLCVITFGIYYFVWYHRIGAELTTFTETPPAAWSRWWSQLIPIYNLIGLYRMAKSLNGAHMQMGSAVRVSPFVTWFWATAWFMSQTRYLQRRINILTEIQ